MKLGKLIVITGPTGSGKDFIADRLISHPELKIHKLKKVITHASRKPRLGEITGIHYHFCSQKMLFSMHKKGELVEKPVSTGLSYKATSKKEFFRILNGENLVWRIDVSLAAKIASGGFFDEVFPSDIASNLKKSVLILFVHADMDTLISRRKKRDGENYAYTDYLKRDEQESAILSSHGHYFHNKISNPNDNFDNTLKQIVTLVQSSI